MHGANHAAGEEVIAGVVSSGNLAAPFCRCAADSPEREALFVEQRVWTYRDLLERAGRIAAWIRARAPGANPKIGILASRSLAAYTGVLGTLWSGGAYVPLGPGLPGGRLRQILDQVRPDALIVDTAGSGRLPELAGSLPEAVLCPDGDGSSACGVCTEGKAAVAGMAPLVTVPALPADALAYLMFTSGTTGAPKGIPVTVGNVLHFLGVMQERYRIGPHDRLSGFTDLTFDLSVFDLFMAMGAGASLQVLPEQALVDPVRFVGQQRITVWFSVPSLIGVAVQLKKLKPASMPTLRLSLFCGEAFPRESAAAWQRAAPHSVIENLYGPTEATVACLLQRYQGDDGVTLERGTIAIGTPYPGMRAAVVDPAGRFLPAHERGELALSGPQLSPGYWRDPKLTAQRFRVLDHPSLGIGRWYLTGDLAFQDPAGRFHFLGRVDNQVKVMGYRIELEEIEHHLREAAGCDNVAAVVWPVIDGYGMAIAAAVENPHLDLGELRRRLKERLPSYMAPRRVLLVDTLPRGPSGKIDRKSVYALLESLRES